MFKSKAQSLRSVLFVCTANVTRSPTMAAMFLALAAKSGEKWDVASAGVSAGRGYPANSVISYRMFKKEMPLTSHRSQPIEARLLKRYRWIITAEQAQKDALLKIDATLEGQIFTLREFGQNRAVAHPDLPDPTGEKELNAYDELFAILDVEIPRLYRALESRISDLEMDAE
jgi:protein arginine phosphatase